MSQITDQQKLRYGHYVCYPDDGLRHEVLDGVHYMDPAPNMYHQVVSKRLQHLLYTSIELSLLIVTGVTVDLTQVW